MFEYFIGVLRLLSVPTIYLLLKSCFDKLFSNLSKSYDSFTRTAIPYANVVETPRMWLQSDNKWVVPIGGGWGGSTPLPPPRDGPKIS